MPLKVVILLLAAIIFGHSNTSIVNSLDADLQMVIKGQL